MFGLLLLRYYGEVEDNFTALKTSLTLTASEFASLLIPENTYIGVSGRTGMVQCLCEL